MSVERTQQTLTSSQMQNQTVYQHPAIPIKRLLSFGQPVALHSHNVSLHKSALHILSFDE